MTGSTATHPTFRVCGVPIAVADLTSAAASIVDAGVAGRPLEVHLCNAYTLSLVDGDAELRRALLAADLNLADGAPVAWLGRGHGLTGPVRGSELVAAVVRLGGAAGHYLYGGAPGIADRMRARLEREVPGARVVGAESPPYTTLDDAELDDLARRIDQAGAEVVWVGLGTPRQDHLVHRLAPLVSRPVVPVGAAFDFWAGAVREAPRVLQGTGLEWIHRLSREPRRLWRRYLLGNPRFVVSAWRHR